MARKKLGEILVEAGVLDAAGLRAALGEQVRWGGPLGRHLVDMKLIREEMLISALSRQSGLPAVDLDRWDIPPSVIGLVDADVAQNLSAVPFQSDGRFLDIAMSDPNNLGAIDEIQIRTKQNVRPYIAGPKAIERALARYYGRGTGATAVDLDASDSGPMQLIGGMELPAPTPVPVVRPEAEVRALQQRLARLEALVARDEDVLRKLMGLLIDKGVATRDEIAEKIR
jgi:hypothetical protein